MTTEQDLPVQDRILQLLKHLGLTKAHFAARHDGDCSGLAAAHPEVFLSLTLVGPNTVNLDSAASLGSRLMVINGDQGARSANVKHNMERAPEASLVTLRDYPVAGWTDVAEYTNEIGSVMRKFLLQVESLETQNTVAPAEGEGEFAGISYRIRGSGPPLVLFPLSLAPSQWEPLIPRLSEGYCTITLGGAELGSVASLEARGRAAGYLTMVKNLIEAANLSPGKALLEVGCGTGVLDRWLARHTGGENRIIGMDINSYFLKEAAALARKDGLEDAIEFREGSAEAIPFSDSSFDITWSITVIEEVDADRMLAEMVRVTKPGGRVAVGARAIDLPWLMNLPLPPGLKAKVEAPGVGSIAELGCADASLYQRFHQAGLTQVKMFPQLSIFDSSSRAVLDYLQAGALSRLDREEAGQWHTARSKAEAEGTFFMAWPHHCAVGTKP